MIKQNNRIIRYAIPFFILILPISGCKSIVENGLGKTYKEGYLFDQAALKSIPIGSSKEQVLQTFGSPSTTTLLNNNTYYYISQTRYQPALFLSPKITDRRILAVYFDKNNHVTKIAQYGLKDGRIFDFISQTTPTLGTDKSLILQFFQGSQVSPELPTVKR